MDKKTIVLESFEKLCKGEHLTFLFNLLRADEYMPDFDLEKPLEEGRGFITEIPYKIGEEIESIPFVSLSLDINEALRSIPLLQEFGNFYKLYYENFYLKVIKDCRKRKEFKARSTFTREIKNALKNGLSIKDSNFSEKLTDKLLDIEEDLYIFGGSEISSSLLDHYSYLSTCAEMLFTIYRRSQERDMRGLYPFYTLSETSPFLGVLYPDKRINPYSFLISEEYSLTLREDFLVGGLREKVLPDYIFANFIEREDRGEFFLFIREMQTIYQYRLNAEREMLLGELGEEITEEEISSPLPKASPTQTQKEEESDENIKSILVRR